MASRDIGELSRSDVADVLERYVVTLPEAAERLGITRPVLWRQARDYSPGGKFGSHPKLRFPKSLGHVGNAEVWFWPEIREWRASCMARQRTPLPPA